MVEKTYEEIVAEYVCKVLDAKTPIDLLTVIINGEPQLQPLRAGDATIDEIIHKIHTRAVISVSKGRERP